MKHLDLIVLVLYQINAFNCLEFLHQTRPFFSQEQNFGRTCPLLKNSPFCDVCGGQEIEPNTKIVGGISALANSWPSMALILFKYTAVYEIAGVKFHSNPVMTYCGGTLIDRETVLTAAHCYNEKVKITVNGFRLNYPVGPNEVHSNVESAYTVFLGLHDLKEILNKTSPQLESGVIRGVKKFIRHPNYNTENYLNDIAIIKLSGEVELGKNVRPACLPLSESYPQMANIPAWTIGWGSVSMSGERSNILQNVRLTYYSSSVCSNVSPFLEKDWNRQICAGEFSGGKDTCQGDSGGPLFVKEIVNGVTKFILVGITSYGDGCAQRGFPGIYTKVAPYLNWISSNIKRLSKAGQLDGQNFGPFKISVKKKRAVKDTVNIVAGGHLAVQLGGQNFGLPR
ncbi:trypsin I-P1-like [Brachionus plicatilis]|uniref:Trypsin I-P1-like n=1 Tax=Brachionus plicatilis TaxID=10195 RepID=A0A3M7R3K5_BRAPC|nr:trypsin I-P1-like [Brachionus plicatilis]